MPLELVPDPTSVILDDGTSLGAAPTQDRPDPASVVLDNGTPLVTADSLHQQLAGADYRSILNRYALAKREGRNEELPTLRELAISRAKQEEVDSVIQDAKDVATAGMYGAPGAAAVKTARIAWDTAKKTPQFLKFALDSAGMLVAEAANVAATIRGLEGLGAGGSKEARRFMAEQSIARGVAGVQSNMVDYEKLATGLGRNVAEAAGYGKLSAEEKFDEDAALEEKALAAATGDTYAKFQAEQIGTFQARKAGRPLDTITEKDTTILGRPRERQVVDPKQFEALANELRAGYNFNPEEIQQTFALLDPVELAATVAGVGIANTARKLAGRAGRSAVTGALPTIGAKLERKAELVTGKTAGEVANETAGKLIAAAGEKGTKFANAATSSPVVSAAVAGGLSVMTGVGDPLTASLLGALVNSSRARIAQRTLGKVGGAVERAGKSLATGKTPLAQFNIAVGNLSADMAKGAASGAAFAAPLALGAESEEEVSDLLAVSGGFGAAGVLQAKPFDLVNVFSPDAKPDSSYTRQAAPVYGSPLDAANQAGHDTLSNRGTATLAAMMDFAKGVIPSGDKLEVLTLNDPVALEQAAASLGYSDPAAASKQNGFAGTRTNPDGSTTHVAVVNLGAQTGGMAAGHEIGEVLWSVMSPDQRLAFAEGAVKSHSSEQLRGFAEAYEERLRAAGGLAEGETYFPRKENGDVDLGNSVSDRVFAEVFSEYAAAAMQGIPLTKFGGSKDYVGQVGSFLRGTAELLGLRRNLSATMRPGEGGTELGINPSEQLKKFVLNLEQADQLNAAPVAEASDLPPVTTDQGLRPVVAPTPEIPKTFLGGDGIVNPIPTELATDPQLNPANVVLDDGTPLVPTPAVEAPKPAPAVETPKPVAENQRGNADAVNKLANLRTTIDPKIETELRDSATRSGGNADAAVAAYSAVSEALSAGRENSKPIRVQYRVAASDTVGKNLSAREGEQIERDAGDRKEVVEEKILVPISAPVRTSAGDYTFTALDATKVLDNVAKLNSFLENQTDAELVRYREAIASRDVNADLAAYTRNHANGYLGDGREYPKAFQQRDAVTPTAGYVPTILPREVVSFLNVAMGNTPPTKLTPGLEAAAEVAVAAGATPTPFGGSVDTNPLRAAIRASGGNPDLIFGGDRSSGNRNSATSVFRMDRINSVSSTPDVGVRPPNNKAIAAGFQPAAPVESEAFKKWFGESKVVNADGTPKVAYHGTDAEFSEFDPKKGRSEGLFFFSADYDGAAGYGETVIPVFLSLQNPAVFDFRGRYWNDYNPPGGPYSVYRDGERVAAKGYFDSEFEAEQAASPGEVVDLSPEPQTTNDLALTARELGHDGVIFKNLRDDSAEASTDEARSAFVAFRPEQIKSATENNGHFDPKNPDIRYQPAALDESLFKPAPGKQTDRVPALREVEKRYTSAHNLTSKPHESLVSIDEDLSMRLADVYDASPDAVEALRPSYEALAAETMEQYRALEAAGLKIEPWLKPGQPYANSPEMVRDVAENKHIYFFLTEGGFGTETSNTTSPMLADSGVEVNGKKLVINDIFRAVHDVFGHAKEGYQFGPRGELNAYLAHSRMFTPEARRALASETLGQNSWVNYGPRMRNAEGKLLRKGDPGYLPQALRPFADQKSVVIPEELIERADKLSEARFQPAAVNWSALPSEGNAYELVPKGDPDPLGHGAQNKWFLTPELRWIAVEEHNTAAAEILGLAASDSDDAPNAAAQLQLGWARVVADDVSPGGVVYLQTSGKTSSAQLRELRNVAIERGLSLIEDRNGREKVLYSPERFQPAQTDTPEFKKWFGKSKVVDVATGAPKVMRHGTKSAFTEFTVPAYFTESTPDAEMFAIGGSGDGEVRIVDAYLSLQNPKVFTKFAEISELSPKAVKKLRALGHDGAILRAFGEPMTAVAFDKTQIKSAAENRGNFDPKNPDIRFQPAALSDEDTARVLDGARLILQQQGKSYAATQRLKTLDKIPADVIAQAKKWAGISDAPQEAPKGTAAPAPTAQLKDRPPLVKPDGELAFPQKELPKKAKLIHFSTREDLSVIDPKFFGTGGGKRANYRMMGGVPKSFFFIDGSLPKAGENVSGGVRYETTADTSRLYDMNEDPADLWSYPNPAKSEGALKASGYEGFFATDNIGRTFVALFNPQRVKLVSKTSEKKVPNMPKGAKFQPALYSQLERTLAAIPEKATRQQIEAAIRDGVKQAGKLIERPVRKEELEDLKDGNGVTLAEFLKQNPEAGLEEIREFAKDAAFPIEVIEKTGADHYWEFDGKRYDTEREAERARDSLIESLAQSDYEYQTAYVKDNEVISEDGNRTLFTSEVIPENERTSEEIENGIEYRILDENGDVEISTTGNDLDSELERLASRHNRYLDTSDSDFDVPSIEEIGTDDEGTKYADYTLAQGPRETYRELILSVGGEYPQYTSGHFEDVDANYLAHARVDDGYKTADGKKVYLIEEIQSDRHQDARDKGYTRPYTPDELAAIRDEMVAARKKHDALAIQYGDADTATRAGTQKIRDAFKKFADENPDKTLDQIGGKGYWTAGAKPNDWFAQLADEHGVYLRVESAVSELNLGTEFNALLPTDKVFLTVVPHDVLREVGKAVDHRLLVQTELYKAREKRDAMGRELSRGRKDGVPDAPFKKSWKEMVFKQLLGDAVERGSDFLAWTPGDEQAKRYSSALQKSVSIVETRKNADGTYDAQFFTSGGGSVADEKNVTATRLSDLVGKSAAATIVETADKAGGEYGTIKGAQLKVGGEGMRAVYDRVLVNFANDFLKKFGVKTESLPLKTRVGTVPVHAVRITPEMRAEITEKGLPRYQPSVRARKQAAIDPTEITPLRPLIIEPDDIQPLAKKR